MTASDPRVGEIQARLDAATPGPWGNVDDTYRSIPVHRIGSEVTGSDVAQVMLMGKQSAADAEFIAAAPADVAYLLAELRKATRAAQTLGQVIEKQCRDVLNVTGLHHLINEDGDGHWDVVWMRLFEMREELARAEAALSERDRHVIPTEAVEAARVKLEDVLGGWFDDLDAIRQILEAAAPHMHAYLLAELRDRDEKLAKVKALHQRVEGYIFGAIPGAEPDYPVCSMCFTEDERPEPWPCATAAAVAAANGGGE